MARNLQSTILVVDDNLGARRSIEALLSNESYRILLAESGTTALQLIEEHTPDVILLDVMMPGMSGYETCKRIRASARVSEVPILMLTALDDEESMIEGIEAGADDFLSKPISKIELRARIRSILRLNRFRKLCDERQKFEVVVTQSKHGYVILDDANDILFANAAAKRMLGIAADHPEPLPFFETARQRFHIQPKDIEEKLSQAARASDLESFILVRSSIDETYARWIRVSFQELGHDFASQNLLRLEDVSDRIVAFQEKHTFSRMISHKLLTPLNAIKAAHQLFKSAETDAERLELLTEIQQQGIDRLEHDLKSILSFLEPDREIKRSITITEAIAQIQNASLPMPSEFSIEAEKALDAARSIAISTHAFDACIREVFENASKFRKSEGVIIECRVVQTNEGKGVAFVFRSNSLALTPSEIENAWQPYWQADRFQTGETAGVGLGLSLIAANVWAAGGSAKIENHEASGSVQLTLRFPVIDLPLADPVK